ncbi:MAG: hypothetical protein ACK559_33180, partial [bacterium]
EQVHAIHAPCQRFPCIGLSGRGNDVDLGGWGVAVVDRLHTVRHGPPGCALLPQWSAAGNHGQDASHGCH